MSVPIINQARSVFKGMAESQIATVVRLYERGRLPSTGNRRSDIIKILVHDLGMNETLVEEWLD